jgi:hypothetical protein
MRALLYVLSFLCLLLPATDALAQERQLYTVGLRNALPEQVLPALQGQVSAGSSINSYHQQLILNVTPDEYRRISALLEQLDQAPRSLLISVRGQGQTSDQRERYGVDGTIGDGNVQVRTGADGSRQMRTETRVTVNQSVRQGRSDGTQQVRAVEGMAAFIAAGNTYPIRSDRYGDRQLTPVTSGFYATARVLGNGEVVVDIDQHNDRMERGNITTQEVQTQVRGRIGEWIVIGGVDQSGGSSEHGIAN